MQVSVASRRDGAAVVLMVSGDIDVTSAPALDSAIRRAVTTTGLELVQVDLSEVDFLDSSGISSLLLGRRGADERGVAFRVTGAHGIARQVLELTGVWEHLSGDSDASQPTPT